MQKSSRGDLDVRKARQDMSRRGVKCMTVCCALSTYAVLKIRMATAADSIETYYVTITRINTFHILFIIRL